MGSVLPKSSVEFDEEVDVEVGAINTEIFPAFDVTMLAWLVLLRRWIPESSLDILEGLSTAVATWTSVATVP